MAREFIDSFETGSLDLWNVTGSSSIVSTAGLDMKGDYCLLVNSGRVSLLLNIFTEKYFAFRFRVSANSSTVLQIYSNGNNDAAITYDCINNRLNVGGGAGSVYGPSNTIYVNTTYFIQFYFKRHNIDGRFVIKINGLPYINYTGDTEYRIYTNEVALFQYTYFDNFVMDNSEMPEETEIMLIRPTASGFYTDFTPVPSGSNYALVDEIPYNDSDYVSSNIENDIDTYNTGSNLPSDIAVVNCVQLQGRAMKDFNATLSGFNFVLRSNDTDYHDIDRIVTETMDNYHNMYLYGPTGSGVWHKTNVDPLEIGVRARA